ncbi:MAG: hypothetical protein BV458_07830, partial [Thermoplasmata archaeon M9B2D]
MNIDRRRRCCAALTVFMILFMAGSPALGIASADFPSDLNVGPFVNKVIYKMIGEQSLALQSGEIDFMTNYVKPQEFLTLDEDPDISIISALRNGYGQITINCAKYPLNVSAFRRSFAFAFDKTRVTTEIRGGFSQEHDSMVPYTNSWCIEDELPYHYYTAQVEIGNQILNDTGFTIDPASGYRLAPNGSLFSVVVEFPSSSMEIAGGCCQIAVDALQALHINAETRAGGLQEIVSRLTYHGDYDMV